MVEKWRNNPSGPSFLFTKIYILYALLQVAAISLPNYTFQFYRQSIQQQIDHTSSHNGRRKTECLQKNDIKFIVISTGQDTKYNNATLFQQDIHEFQNTKGHKIVYLCRHKTWSIAQKSTLQMSPNCYTERPSDEKQQLYRINGLSRYRCYIYHYNLLVILPS